MSEQDERARKVKTRRMKRKLKAAASVALALSAGVFLACQRGASEVSRLVDAARGADDDAMAGEDASADATDPQIVVRDASGNVVAPEDAGQDGGQGLDASRRPDAALAKRPATTKGAAVDVNEHRKGMPVRDNLLE
jgi:hypothetical protein